MATDNRRFGLQRLRENANLTRADAANRIGVTETAYSNWERGSAAPRMGRRSRITAVLGVTKEELSTALDITARGIDAAPPVNNELSQGLGILAAIEAGVPAVRVWEPFTVPALLQTEPYAAAVEAGAVDATPDLVAVRVHHRLTRQQALHRDGEPLRLSVVMDESVLWRQTGSLPVMRDQLNHLLDATDWSNVEFQVLPLGAGVHVGGWGMFNLTTDGGGQPAILATTNRLGVNYSELAEVVTRYAEVFDLLSELALPPSDSVDLIRRILQERYT